MDMMCRIKARLQSEGTIVTDNEITDSIEMAKNAILARRFPFHEWPNEVEPRYQDLQYRIAIDLINKMGAEGEMVHNENGVGRTYQSAWISEQLLSEITPYAKVP